MTRPTPKALKAAADRLMASDYADLVPLEFIGPVVDLIAEAVWTEALASLDDIAEHVVELRNDGWTIKHPLACRPDLFNCPVNRVAEAELVEPPKGRGRFPVWLDEQGRMSMGEEIR